MTEEPEEKTTEIPTTPVLEVRPAVTEDIPGIAECLLQGFGAKMTHMGFKSDEDTLKVFQALVEAEDKAGRLALKYGVAVDSGSVLGVCELKYPGEAGVQPDIGFCEWVGYFGGCCRCIPGTLRQVMAEQKSPAGTVMVSMISVRAEARGRGVGSRLMDWSKRAAQTFFEQHQPASQANMVLDVVFDNPAQRLYERAGYEVVSTQSGCCIRWVLGVKGATTMRVSWQVSDGPQLFYPAEGTPAPVAATMSRGDDEGEATGAMSGEHVLPGQVDDLAAEDGAEKAAAGPDVQ